LPEEIKEQEEEKEPITEEQKKVIRFFVAQSMFAGRQRANTKDGGKLYFPKISVMKKYTRYSKEHVFKTASKAEGYAKRWLGKYRSMLTWEEDNPEKMEKILSA